MVEDVDIIVYTNGLPEGGVTGGGAGVAAYLAGSWRKPGVDQQVRCAAPMEPNSPLLRRRCGGERMENISHGDRQ